MGLLRPAGGGRVLDFDIENRPLSYWVPDKPTCEITAIASQWIGDPSSLRVDVLTPAPWTLGDMLLSFIDRYNQADMVTGHYIRMHDLPIINGALYELGFPLLSPKLTCDTKLDMFKKGDVPATQEFLLETLGVTDEDGEPLRKYHMSQSDWRESNRLTPAGIEKTIARVSSDVRDHIELRKAMLSHGMLGRPKTWYPGGGIDPGIG